jgi:uncharacterized protein
MRLILFVIILLLLDWYVFQVVRVLSHDKPATFKYIWKGSYWMTSLLAFVLGLAAVQGWFSHWSYTSLSYLRALLLIFYLSKLFIGLFLFVDDFRRLVQWGFSLIQKPHVFDLSRSYFMVNAALAAGILPFTSLIYGMVRNPYRYQVKSESITMPALNGLPPLKIVHISDIHSGSFTDKEAVAKGVEMINELKPDLVLFTGDIVNNRTEELEPYLEIFSSIRSKHGVYSVLGNHDYGDYVSWSSVEEKKKNMSLLIEMQRSMGWKLLLDENDTLDWHGKKISISGIQNSSSIMQFKSYGDLDKALDGTDQMDLRILLSHDPSFWESNIIKHNIKVDLTLSGHTHGFQFGVDIPGWFKWSPAQYVYKQWAGLYEQSNKYIYVNRGYGFLGYPGRVGILPEITSLTLHGKKSVEI